MSGNRKCSPNPNQIYRRDKDKVSGIKFVLLFACVPTGLCWHTLLLPCDISWVRVYR